MVLTKIYDKSFNLERLLEELTTARIGVSSISWPGFHQTDRFIFSPNVDRQPYARKFDQGVETILEADPGEMHIEIEIDPGASLDNVLGAHNSNQKSQGEIDYDQMLVDKTTLEQALNSFAFPFTGSNPGIRALGRLVLRKFFK